MEDKVRKYLFKILSISQLGGETMAHKGSGLIKAAFDTDNFLMRFCEKVLDIVTVNLLFVVSCLPIVTIGVAKISLYQTMFEIKKSPKGTRI